MGVVYDAIHALQDIKKLQGGKIMEKPFLDENTQVELFISLANHMANLIVAERELQSLQQEWLRLDQQEQVLQNQLVLLNVIPTF